MTPLKTQASLRRFACGVASAVLVASLLLSCADSPSAPRRTASPVTTFASWSECKTEYVGPNEDVPNWIFDENDEWEIDDIDFNASTNEVWIRLCREGSDDDPPGDYPELEGDCFSTPWLPECDSDPPPPPCMPSCGGGDPSGDSGPVADSVVVVVRADSTNVKFGSTVKFTAQVIATNGGSYTPDGWTWTGKPGTTCETNLVCQMRVTASGWMRYQAHKGGAYDIDSIRITVAPPRLRVTCNGDTTQVTVTRAANVSCSATSASGGTVTAVAWEFVATAPVGTIASSVLGSANPLAGPVVDSGRLILSGTIDTVAATPDSIPLRVNARALTNFQWLPPLINAAILPNCSGYFDISWGWTAVANTCDFDHVLSPLVTTTNGGVVTSEVSAGPNRSLHYVASWSARVNVGYDYIPELKGAGRNFTLLRSDPNLGQCITNPSLTQVSTQLAPINNCTIGRVATPVTAVGQAMNAHEVCHQTYDIQAFNALNATPASEVQRVPAFIEAAVRRSAADVIGVTRPLLVTADRAIINVGHLALDIPSGNAIPMWGPADSVYTNWADLSWDSVRTC